MEACLSNGVDCVLFQTLPSLVQPAAWPDHVTASPPPVPFHFTGGYSDWTPPECFKAGQSKTPFRLGMLKNTSGIM